MESSFVAKHGLEVGLYASLLWLSYKLVVYIQRLFFHPLSRFPGPKICAASRLYEFYWDSWHHGRFWAHLPALHRKYGPIVRIGPNEVHIEDSEYFDTLIGFRPLNKEAMTAKQFGLNHALFGTEDYKLYTRRRAAFGDAFSRSKILKLQDMINGHIEKACTWVQKHIDKGEYVDMAYIYRATPAEIITDYLFGQQYGFIDDVKATKNLYDREQFDKVFGFANLGRFIPYQIPLIATFIRQITKQAIGLNDPGSAFMGYFLFARKLVQKVVDEHEKPTSWTIDRAHPTVFEDYLGSDLPPEEKRGSPLTEQSVAIWSGGWETVGFALTVGTYLLLRNPQIKQRMEDELKSSWEDPNERPNMKVLDELPYFNAVLKEVFRLGPSPLCRLSRINPNAPEQYGKWMIPAGTIISVSIPDVHADPKIWGPDPEVFRPERWLDRPDLDKYLVTFSKGTRVCPGIELAWVESRLLLATMFRRFELTIPQEVNVTDEDIMPYYESFTPNPKTWMHQLILAAKPLV